MNDPRSILEASAAAALPSGKVTYASGGGVAGVPLEVGLALERELQAKLFASKDAREGSTAFVEKRKPRFEGA